MIIRFNEEGRACLTTLESLQKSNLVHRGVYKNKLNLNLGKTGKPVLVKIKFRYDTCINLVICTTRNWICQTFQSESFKYFFLYI